MDNRQRNDTHQNIKVVLPPRPDRKAKGKAEPAAEQKNTQPDRKSVV